MKEAKIISTEPQAQLAFSRDQAASEPEGAPAMHMVRIGDFAAPFTLMPAQEDEYLRRFSTLLVDDSSERIGGTARVMCATNAFGERVALKVPKAPEAADAHMRFDHEFQTQRMVSGVRGYPKLYGRGMLNGQPCLIQEWIEGEPLLTARMRMGVDDEMRVSPLTAARIGRDLFDILARMDALSETVVHRDISLRNVMVRTGRQSVEDQVQEGAFELCVIDLGSSASIAQSGGGLAEASQMGGATPEFAAPESLAVDSADTTPAISPALDVYAAARVVCALLHGSGNINAHEAAGDIAAVLLREPEVAVMVSRIASGISPCPDASEVREALVQVDSMLVAILDECLHADPRKRMSAASARDALAAFCDQYAGNLERALRGEAMESPLSSAGRMGPRLLSARSRTLVRSIGKGISLALWATCAIATGVLLNGAPIAPMDGSLMGIAGLPGAVASALVLAMPCMGLLLRWKNTSSGAGLLRGTLGIFAGATALFVLIAGVGFQGRVAEHLAIAAALMTSAASWCYMVFDYAFPSPSTRVRKRLSDGKAPRVALLQGAQGGACEDGQREGLASAYAAAGAHEKGREDD